jgi:hypothetical protein
MTEQEKKHYEDVVYPEIARKDFERELYKEMDIDERRYIENSSIEEFEEFER